MELCSIRSELTIGYYCANIVVVWCSVIDILSVLISYLSISKVCPSNKNSKPAPYTSPPEGKWSTGLCGCFEDLSTCWVTCWLLLSPHHLWPHCLDSGPGTNMPYMMLAHVFGACLYACTYRAKLRGLYSLPPESCRDCCVHHFCFCCALCQEYRKLKNRGLDPSLGWTVNAQIENEKRNHSTSGSSTGHDLLGSAFIPVLHSS
uniref:Uncharacterized protein n=1 Tax=Quercus lobata TaxID=97700 RepID=A0A7N2R0T7_QUELO